MALPDLRALQHQLVLEGLYEGFELKDRELKRIIGADAFAIYEATVAAAKVEAEKAKQQLHCGTPEGQAFWLASIPFWQDAFKVWIMRETNANFREYKKNAEEALFAKHDPILKTLWDAVPDKENFYEQGIHATFDVGSVPRYIIPPKAREQRDRAAIMARKKALRNGKPVPTPLVLNRKAWIIRTVYEVDSTHETIPLPQQIDAMEAFLKPPVPVLAIVEA